MTRKIYDLIRSFCGGMGLLCMSLMLSFFMLPSCIKPPVEPVDPCEINLCDTSKLMGKLDTLWTTLIRADQNYGLNFGLIHYNGKVMNNYIGATDYGLGMYDEIDGKQIFEWQESETDGFSNFLLNEAESNVILQNNGLIVKVDPLTGSTLKEFRFTDDFSAHTFGQILDGYFYCTRRKEDESVAWLLRSPVSDLENWETVYTLTRGAETGESRPNIESYNLWINPNTGDSILIFQHRMSSPNRIDVVAWNMTSKSIAWQHNNIEPSGNSGLHQIFIHNGKAYFQGLNTVYCFRMTDGEILWQNRYLDIPKRGFGNSNIIYASNENLIIYKSDGFTINEERITAVNPESGSVVWDHKGGGVNANEMSYHFGIVYYTAEARLWAVRASNGEIIWSEKSRLHNNSQFDGPVTIDPERGVLYASDRRYILAIKLYNN